mmetsp:Transcript_4257/g.4783  ORF Transcript_4257/g.4783 Transcript_4257/m.4783 type:complete len:86 (+) Transcript_4257:110-367(+)
MGSHGSPSSISTSAPTMLVSPPSRHQAVAILAQAGLAPGFYKFFAGLSSSLFESSRAMPSAAPNLAGLSGMALVSASLCSPSASL